MSRKKHYSCLERGTQRSRPEGSAKNVQKLHATPPQAKEKPTSQDGRTGKIGFKRTHGMFRLSLLDDDDNGNGEAVSEGGTKSIEDSTESGESSCNGGRM
jgi:hypothetical protein